MGGGFLQLSAIGTENIFFNGNPQLSFFKFVFKRYTNFAMEDILIAMESTNDALSFDKSTIFRVRIPRNGDMLSKLFLKLRLPKIHSNDRQKFYWVDSIGTRILDYATLFIGGNKIETIRGDLLHIQKELFHSQSRQRIMEELLGDQSVNTPQSVFQQNYPGHDSVNIDTTTNTQYPTLSKYWKSPSFIKEQTLYIPLSYWFTKNFGLSLPLIALQYHEVSLEIALRPIQDLYTVLRFDKKYYYYAEDHANIQNDNAFWESTPTQKVQHLRETTPLLSYDSYYRTRPNAKEEHIRHFLSDGGSLVGGTSEISWDLKLELCATYIFLETTERNLVAKTATSFLVEQHRVLTEMGVKSLATVKMTDLYHPTKNVFFTCSRNDNRDSNTLYNYTTHPQIDQNRHVLEYQNNWWYTAVKRAHTAPITVTPTVNGSPITLVCDRFQEWLFLFGPYGEAGVYRSTANNNAAYNTVVGFRIQDKYSLHTMQQIRDFKENVWKYVRAQDIPIIDTGNQHNFGANPLKDCRILFDGQIREDTHDTAYFNQVKNYCFYTSQPSHPIYSYSFALHPSKYIPSGFVNLSKINSVEFHMNLNFPALLPDSQQVDEYDWDYNITFYFCRYNFLDIQAGMAGMRFAI